MSTRRSLPPTASVATPQDGPRLHAPAAARNVDAITTLLTQIAPPRGQALELASGTGQHIIAFARALPHLHWQPTEIDAARRASIDTYAADTGLTNIAAARALDATQPGWGADHAGQNLVVLINLLHLISAPETRTVITEAARALSPAGRFLIYGPFLRAGELTSEGDQRFDQALRAQDPDIGYKDDFDTLDLGLAAGLEVDSVIEMPANNLALVFRGAG